MSNKDRISQKAFTLIELLIVIAIIAVLISILAPALQIAKRKAASAICLTNVRSLAAGWHMYQEDNKSRIMCANDDYNSAAYENSGKFVGWIGVPRLEDGRGLSISQTDPPVTDKDEIRGIERGVLYPYVNSAQAYHCPSDNIRKSVFDNTEVFVSYSIPNCLFGEARSDQAGYSIQIIKHHAISFPETRYCFVETAETRNWNMSHHFVIAAPEYTGNSEWGWWGPMAINHGDSSILGFCDGHAERHIWIDPFTFEHYEKVLNQGGGSYGQQYPPADQQTDINYMGQGWPYRHQLY